MAKRGANGKGNSVGEAAALDARQARAVELVLAGRKPPEVAAELGVNRSTAWRWTVEPAFARELARERDARRCAVREKLDAAAGEAVDVLLAVLRDTGARPADRVRAACAVLDRAGWTVPDVPALSPGAAGVEGWAEREAERRDAAAAGSRDPLDDVLDNGEGKARRLAELTQRVIREA